MKQKIVHIVGPTGVGKTDLALSLARKFNASLISADSVQVYKGLDIISGKDNPKGSKFNLIKKIPDKYELGYYNFFSVKVYLLDIVKPSDTFSVFDFLKLSKEALNIVLIDGKIPIVVGGTGLYSEKLISGLDDFGNIDEKLREKLEKLSLDKLQTMLRKLNIGKIESMNNSDLNNKRRLVRAIEIESRKTQEMRRKNHEAIKREAGIYDNLVIGLRCDREVLKKRIVKRVKLRLENGALDEAKKLFKNYNSLSPSVKNANGYKQLFSYLKKEIDLEEAILRWEISENRYAKNQMTWLKKHGNVMWFDITKKGFEKDIDKEISNFLT